MDITYFEDDNPKIFEAEFVDPNKPEKWAVDFNGYHADFLCYTLNREPWKLLGYSQKFITDKMERDRNFDKLYSDVKEELLRAGKSDLENDVIVDSKKRNERDYVEYKWMIDSLNSLDMETYTKLIELVLLNRDSYLTASQRMLAYESVYGYPSIRNFSAICNYSFFISDPNMNPDLSDENLTFEEAIETLKKQNLPVSSSFIYKINNFEDLLNIVVYKTIKENDYVKKCPNCGKYFYPGANSNMMYCDNVSPQDQSKTCGEYCKYIKYLTKNRNDEATKLYKQIYNIKANRYKRTKTEACPEGNPTLNDDLGSFTVLGNKWKLEVKSGEKSENQYISWLKEIKEGAINGDNSKTR